jgi:hypothetical protein
VLLTPASHTGNNRKFWIVRQLSDFNLVRVTPEAQKPAGLKTHFNIKVENVEHENE